MTDDKFCEPACQINRCDLYGCHKDPDAPLRNIAQKARMLIEEAQAAGVVLTIELTPFEPLAMGRYTMRAECRHARPLAERQPLPQMPTMCVTCLTMSDSINRSRYCNGTGDCAADRRWEAEPRLIQRFGGGAGGKQS